MLGFRITLVKDILEQYVTLVSNICQRGIETVAYENGMILVNHRSTPFLLSQKYREEIYQYPWHGEQEEKGVLGGHEAVWISL